MCRQRMGINKHKFDKLLKFKKRFEKYEKLSLLLFFVVFLFPYCMQKHNTVHD